MHLAFHVQDEPSPEVSTRLLSWFVGLLSVACLFARIWLLYHALTLQRDAGNVSQISLDVAQWAMRPLPAWGGMNMFRRWAEGTMHAVLGAIIFSLIPGAFITYLVREQSSWSGPILMGMCASALAMIIFLAIDAIRRLPPRRVIPSLRNIESCVRDWLNNFQYSVKKSPFETAYFRYQVTVESGTKMFIGRTKNDLQDYIQVRCDMSPTESDMSYFNSLSDLQKGVIIGNLRLELARRSVGYQNLTLPADNFFITKRIPIRETLTEHEFIAAIDEVEAAAHSVMFVFALEIVKTGKLPIAVQTNEPKKLDTL
jgi:hypothetical protein